MKTISRFILAIAAIMFAFAASAEVTKISTTVENVDFNNGRGDRQVAQVEAVAKAGDATFVVNGAYGKRDYGEGVSFNGQRVQGTLYFDWGKALSSKTSATWSSNDPVFVNREIAHDFNVKVIPNTVLTVGGRYSEYFGGVYISAWNVGGTYYWDRLSATYRYSKYHSSLGGSTDANMVSLRLRDSEGRGNTQLWLGKGSSLYAYDWTSDLGVGDQKSVVLRRVQPIGQKLDLTVGVGKVWYENPFSKYEGVSANVGLVYNW